MLSHSVMSDSVTLWTVARQVPLSMRFPSQEYWSGLPFPPPLIEDTCKKINYKMVPRRYSRIFEIGDVGERLMNLDRGGGVRKGSNEEVT